MLGPTQSSKPSRALKLCGVIAQPADDAGGREVHAHCWGTSVVLGRADKHRTFLSPELDATLVELERAGEVRVVLLRPGADGKPLLEDISGPLSLAAGREPWGRLRGITLDYTEFTGRGRIGVRRAAGDPPGPSERGQAARLSVPVAEQFVEVSSLPAAARAGEQQ